MQEVSPTERAGRKGAALAIIAVVVIMIGLGTVVVQGALKERRDNNERTAINSIRALNTALYLHRQKNNDSYPGSMDKFAGVEAALACGQAECIHSGYRFRYELLPASAMGPRYVITARPNKFQNTGVQSFYSDESGVIRATTDDRPAAKGDTPVS